MTLGISKKFFILFSLFILIFSGTVFDLFIKVQDMSRLSARIVTVNNQVAALADNLQDYLLDMEVNHKKFTLLGKQIYFEYFETARMNYNRDLARIVRLDSLGYPATNQWEKIQHTYAGYTVFQSAEKPDKIPLQWQHKKGVDPWMAAIIQAGKDNNDRTQKSLIRINELSRKVVRNGVVGFGISIVVGIVGIMFISRSMLTPLNKLKAGLTQISNDNYTHRIEIASKDEFHELAEAFNDMSRQLSEDEDIRSDFIATLSHEIRTPLSSVQESVNMIVEQLLGPVNEKQKKFLTLADSELTRIKSLLNHLLDISVLESGSDRSGFKQMDPYKLVREAVRLIEPTADLKQITLHLETIQDAPAVTGEKKELMQVLMNIIGNAVKFSDKNSRVKISFSKPGNQGSLFFYISDQGPGIPKDEQRLIFKKYYRTRSVRKYMSGVGLGLNISRRIVRAHGGEIGVKNNEKKGCTFWFTLPVHNKKGDVGGA